MQSIQDVIQFLQECKETHVGAALQEVDPDPDTEWWIGDREFHEQCIIEYSMAICILEDALRYGVDKYEQG